MPFTRQEREAIREAMMMAFQEPDFQSALKAALGVIDGTPGLRSVGYLTDDGGTADPHHKSFGDFLMAVMRHDDKRLRRIYGSKLDFETKDVSSTSGPAGGYLIPEEYHARLMRVVRDAAVVRPRATVIPVASDRGRIPSLDVFTAPTAGQGDTALAGGMTLKWTSPGANLTEDQPAFEQIEYSIKKLAGYTEVENEVIADSPHAMDALLTTIFGIAVANMEDYAFLRGNGAEEPLGILNAACAIGVTPATDNTFAFTDAGNMRARFRKVGGQPVWVMHPGLWPDLLAFEVSSGSGGVWIANLAAGAPEGLLGYPILESEHLPQDDNSGCVMLADFKGYGHLRPRRNVRGLLRARCLHQRQRHMEGDPEGRWPTVAFEHHHAC